MPVKTPQFWYRTLETQPSLCERALSLFSSLYAFGHTLKVKRTTTKHVDIPVICVGNVTAGGSGKTPSCIALNAILKDINLNQPSFFLSRGYGAKTGQSRLISGHDDASDTGDEPLLLAKHSKTIVSASRYDGAKKAQDLGAGCIIMDDGYQNFSLAKTLSFLVIDGTYGFGNEKILPGGPLREPIADAMQRANAIILIGEDKRCALAHVPQNIPVFRGALKPSSALNIDLSQPYIGFAGLAHPNKFKETLLQNKIDLLAFHGFADHHPYNDAEIVSLLEDAKTKGAHLITTEKDFVRIPSRYQKHISTLPVYLEWDDKESLATFLRETLKKYGEQS